MPKQGESFAITYLAVDSVTAEPIDGDAAHHTLSFIRDNATFVPVNAPVGLGIGRYSVVLTAAETTGKSYDVGGTSSTNDVRIIGYPFFLEPADVASSGVGEYPGAVTYRPTRTLVTVVRDYSTGVERIWRTDSSTFEAYNSANAAHYTIATAPAGSPDQYAWSVPALPSLAAPGEYVATTYDVTGTTLAASFAAAAGPTSAWACAFGWDGSHPLKWVRATNPYVVRKVTNASSEASTS